MHGSIATWLTAHPRQAALIAACFGVLSLQGAVVFVLLASAIPVLLILERGVSAGINAMLAASVAVLIVLLWFQQPLWFALAYVLIVFGWPVLLGTLLQRWGSLNLVFQLTLVAALLAVAAVFMFVLQPVMIWVQLLKQAFAGLAQAGFAMDESLIGRLAETMWGAFIAVSLLMTLGAVLLARWWQSLLHAPGEFGREFRELRSGMVLGTMLIGVSLASLFVSLPWLNSMAWVAMLGLALQGLATVHRRKAEGQLRQGWLVAMYVLLIVPLFSFMTVALLAGCGLADFWRRLRLRAAQPS